PTGLAPIVEPLADYFGCRHIVTKHIIEVHVVHSRIEEVFQCRKLAVVAHETDGIKRYHLQDHLDLIIVPVEASARLLGREPLMVCEAETVKRLAMVYMILVVTG